MALYGFSGELTITPPLGPEESLALSLFLKKVQKSTPTGCSPFELSASGGIQWDTTDFVGIPDYGSLNHAAQWLSEHIIPTYIEPFRILSGALSNPDGVIVVKDNNVEVLVDPPDDETNSASKYPKPAPKSSTKPKGFAKLLAEQKNPEYVPEPVNTAQIVSDLQAKIDLLENVSAEKQKLIGNLETQNTLLKKLNKPKKSKTLPIPQGKRWYRLTVSAAIDKDKFVEGLKMTIMGVDEIEVFE